MRVAFRHFLLDSEGTMLTFKSDGTLVPPLRDRHVRARAELALALDSPDPRANVAEASTRFVARGGQWKPPPALVRRIEQTDRLGTTQMPLGCHPLRPAANDRLPRPSGVIQIHYRPATVSDRAETAASQRPLTALGLIELSLVPAMEEISLNARTF